MTGRDTGFEKGAVCSSEKTSPLNVQGDAKGKFNILWVIVSVIPDPLLVPRSKIE
jgi:hypothetical protein